MWKKKRYDIHIRLSPEDIESLGRTISLANTIAHQFFNIDTKPQYIKTALGVILKIHNKCVEINRR